MIVISELNHGGIIHVVVNASLIKILTTVFPDEKISFYGDKDHIVSLHNNTTVGQQISFSSIRITGPAKYKLPFKIFCDILNFLKLLSLSKKNQTNLLFITSLYPVSHCFFKIIADFFSTKIIVILHGELEFIRKNKKNAYVKVLGWFLQKALTRKSKNITYLILGDVIKHNLSEICKVKDEIISIDHPYLYADMETEVKKDNCLLMGCVGVGSIDKRMDKLFTLAAGFKAEILQNKIRFCSVGSMLSNMQKHLNEYVHYNTGKILLDRETYEKKILELDYILFFYDNEYYKMCSSGAFFDAVNFEKPIIALKNDFFEYYFNKLGDIGFLTDSLEEMTALIQEVIAGKHCKRYLLQKNNLKQAKHRLSLPQLSIDLKSELIRTGFLSE